jgi:hydrogenase expression/formation protein HypE
MVAREGLPFETAIESDCAPLAAPVLDLIEAGIGVHCLRDLSRGGLASALVEVAEAARLGVSLEEHSIPVCAEVTAACELLGLDPLHVANANEGRFIAFVAPEDAHRDVALLQRHAVSSAATMIGKVTGGPPGRSRAAAPLVSSASSTS